MDNVAAWGHHTTNATLWHNIKHLDPSLPSLHNLDEEEQVLAIDDFQDTIDDDSDDDDYDDLVSTPGPYFNDVPMSLSVAHPLPETTLPPFSSIAHPVQRHWPSVLSPRTRSMDPSSRLPQRQNGLQNGSHNDLSSALESFSFAQNEQMFSTSNPPPYNHHQHRPPHTADRRVKTPESQRAQHRIAEFVAQNTASMICYLWFGNIGNSPAASPMSSSSPSAARRLPPSSPHTDFETARLQFVPSPSFVDFLHRLLTTTQVSQSVIVLSLHYIYRLKSANRNIRGKAGSELRLAVTALMLANKFLDDNTYTNKTWSDISRISLTEINQMEREFLHGVDNRLYVDLATYESWGQLLNGLISAKEKEYEMFRRRAEPMMTKNANYSPSSHLAQRIRAPSPSWRDGQRARSSSPQRAPYPFTFTLPPLAQPNPFATQPAQPQSHPSHHHHQHQSPLASRSQPIEPSAQSAARPGTKRTVLEAFSPQSASQSVHPSKRPLSLDLDFARMAPMATYDAPMEYASSDSSSVVDSAMYPADVQRQPEPPMNHHMQDVPMLPTPETASLHPPPSRGMYQHTPESSRTSVSSMSSSGSSGAGLPAYTVPSQPTAHQALLAKPSGGMAHGAAPAPMHPPRMLAAPLRVDERWNGSAIPQYLTFNSLSASPLGDELQHENGARKTVLRYHQPAPHYQHRPAASYSYAYNSKALGVQSARTSPRDINMAHPVSSMAVDHHHQPHTPNYPPTLAAAQHHNIQIQPPSHSNNVHFHYLHPTALSTPPPSSSGHPAHNSLHHQSINISPPHLTMSSSNSSTQSHQPPYTPSPGYGRQHHQQGGPRYPSPLAKFANAGPPGYQWRAPSAFSNAAHCGFGSAGVGETGAAAARAYESPASTTMGAGESGGSPAGYYGGCQPYHYQQSSQSQAHLPTYANGTSDNGSAHHPPALVPMSQPSSHSHASTSQGWSNTSSPIVRGRRG